MSSTFSGDETVPFFGSLGAVAALVFSCMGAAYGTAKSRVGVKSMGVMRPELVMKSIMLVVMADVLGIYDLISSGFLNLGPWDYSVTVTVVPLVIFLIYGFCL